MSNHVVADIGTRIVAGLKTINQESILINGYPWMKSPVSEFPVTMEVYNRMEWKLFLTISFYDILYSIFFVNDNNLSLKRFSKTQFVYVKEGMFKLHNARETIDSKIVEELRRDNVKSLSKKTAKKENNNKTLQS